MQGIIRLAVPPGRPLPGKEPYRGFMAAFLTKKEGAYASDFIEAV